MGFNITILACAMTDKDSLLAEFGLDETAEPDEANEAPFSYAVVGTHYLVWQNWRKTKPLDEVLIAKGSSAFPIYGCFISESTMWCKTSLFNAGREEWSVTHDSDISKDNIQIAGTPPAQLNGILSEIGRQAIEEADDMVDFYFDGPTLLFKSITGFKHDEVPEVEVRFFKLKSQMAQKRPFWKFWG